MGLHAQIVLILSVLHIFLYTHQRQRCFDEDTDTRTHLLLSIIIIVSAGEESTLLFVITGVWSEREDFSRREKGMDGTGKKERVGQKKKAPACLWHISHILP